MSKSKANCELRRHASYAKKRLQVGYWKQVEQEKQEALDKMGYSVTAVQAVKNMLRDRFFRELHRLENLEAIQKEDEMYAKVCKILKNDELNPIGELIDRNMYEQLDDVGRQKYILELSDKFKVFKDRYLAENSIAK